MGRIGGKNYCGEYFSGKSLRGLYRFLSSVPLNCFSRRPRHKRPCEWAPSFSRTGTAHGHKPPESSCCWGKFRGKFRGGFLFLLTYLSLAQTLPWRTFGELSTHSSDESLQYSCLRLLPPFYCGWQVRGLRLGNVVEKNLVVGGFRVGLRFRLSGWVDEALGRRPDMGSSGSPCSFPRPCPRIFVSLHLPLPAGVKVPQSWVCPEPPFKASSTRDRIVGWVDQGLGSVPPRGWVLHGRLFGGIVSVPLTSPKVPRVF